MTEAITSDDGSDSADQYDLVAGAEHYGLGRLGRLQPRRRRPPKRRPSRPRWSARSGSCVNRCKISRPRSTRLKRENAQKDAALAAAQQSAQSASAAGRGRISQGRQPQFQHLLERRQRRLPQQHSDRSQVHHRRHGPDYQRHQEVHHGPDGVASRPLLQGDGDYTSCASSRVNPFTVAFPELRRQHSLQLHPIPRRSPGSHQRVQLLRPSEQNRRPLPSPAFGGLPLRCLREADFLGAGITSNDNQSNSYVLRQRQIFGQAGTNKGFTITGGQMWSL